MERKVVLRITLWGHLGAGILSVHDQKTAQKAWAGDMAQPLRVLAALPEVPGSISSTHMAVLNCLYLKFQGI